MTTAIVETVPKWFELAQKELGTKEVPGPKSNAKVSNYFKDSGAGFLQDSVPWCAAFVGAMLKRAGVKPSGSLMARSYLAWGERLLYPKKGCVVVFARGRPPSGHVAFFDSFNKNGTLRVLGGNQTDAVTYGNYKPSAVLGYRWPHEKTLVVAVATVTRVV